MSNNMLAKEDKMKEKIETKVYVFTTQGLVKGKVIKERVDKYTGKTQYKLLINEKEYNYWFSEGQLFSSRFTATMKELVKPLFKKA